MKEKDFWSQFEPVQQISSRQEESDFWGQFEPVQSSAPQNNTESQSINDTSESFGKKAARTAKSAAAGIIGAIPDTAALAYNLPALGLQAAGVNAPMIPSVTEAVDRGIDTLTGGYTETPAEARPFQEGIKTGASILGGGGLATAAGKLGSKAAQKALGYVGSTAPTAVAGGAAAGYGTAKAQEAGYGAPASIGIGLGAGMLPSAAIGAIGGIRNLPKSLVQMSPLKAKNIDLEAVSAAERAGLDYPATYASTSPAAASVEQIVQRSPFIGERYNKKIKNIDEAYSGKVKDILDTVGDKVSHSEKPAENVFTVGDKTQKFLERTSSLLEGEKESLYKIADSILPDSEKTSFSGLVSAIEEVKSRINNTLVLTDDYVYALKKIKEIEDNLKEIPSKNNALQSSRKLIDINKIPKSLLYKNNTLRVKKLTDTKVKLNSIIDWDAAKEGVKDTSLLEILRGGVVSDLKRYGQTNKQWWEAYSKAEEFYGKYWGDQALGSKIVKKILRQEDPEKVLRIINTPSDLKKIKNTLGNSKAGDEFFKSIKREKLDSILMGDNILDKSGNISYPRFSNIFNSPDNVAMIKYIAGDASYKKLKDLQKYAEGMIGRSKRNPNPSGTATTGTVIGVIAGLFTGSGIVSGVANVAKSAAALTAASTIVTNKKLLNIAVNAAKERASGAKSTKWTERLNKDLAKEIGEDKFKELLALTRQEERQNTRND